MNLLPQYHEDSVRNLRKEIENLTEENKKLRAWKARALEENLLCCRKCTEFIDEPLPNTCSACCKHYCKGCWRSETLQRGLTGVSIIVCHECSPPVCGWCKSPKVTIFCPRKYCEESFCSTECYRLHCSSEDTNSSLRTFC
jgi:hypothetical protein